MESNLADVWAAWKLAHLDGTGRVIDRMQQDSSHSEGQAYGMLLAATMGDRPAFDRIEAWTKVNLAIRADHLTAWRWLPEASERVPDMNNASDGDLFRAWALLKASEKFSAPQYRDLAQLIVSDLIATCIVERDGVDALPLLLPAAEGFRTASGFIINPCYSMPLAMTELATALDQPLLAREARGAVVLMEKLLLSSIKQVKSLRPARMQAINRSLLCRFAPHRTFLDRNCRRLLRLILIIPPHCRCLR